MDWFRQYIAVFHFLVIIGSVAARALEGVQLQHWRSLLADVDMMVHYGEGTLLPPNDTASGGGCVLLPDVLPSGDPLVSPEDNLQPSLEECCRSCRELERCNVFWYCREQDGCSAADIVSSRNFTAPFQGCGLEFQSQSSQAVGQSIVAVPAPGYTGGGPIRIKPPPIQGYDVIPGLWFYQRCAPCYDYQCNGTADPFKKLCARVGSPNNASYVCDEDPRCRGFVSFEHGRENYGKSILIYKGGEGVAELNQSDAYFNPNAALYVRKEPAVLPAVTPGTGSEGGSSGGGISTGAVVGIVVGSVCALGLAVAGAVVLVRRRRRRLQEVQQGPDKGGSTQEGRDSGAVAGLSSASWPQEQAQSGRASRSSIRSQSDSAQGLHKAPASSTSRKSSARLNSTLSQVLTTVPAPPGVSRCPPASWEAGTDSLASPFGSMSSDRLLSNLPDDDWTASIVDFKDIQFCENPDGSLVQLGSGAFSTVYRVMLSGVAPHAAKMLQLSDDPKQAEMFIKEVSMLRTLRHRNIICFAGVCVWEDKGIILMELAEGKSLHARLGSVNRGKTVALDIANALFYLHSHNVVHFDVKSGNVLLTRDGTAKLCDVGLSRALRHTHQSLSHGSPGTFDFMAPELLMGRQCTPAVDIYSFGVLLWEICTGEYAVRGCMGRLSVPEQCPQAVADLFLECIDEDPAKRPSARDLTARLMALQQNSRRREEV